MFGVEEEFNEDDTDFMEMYAIDDTLDSLSKLEKYHGSDFALQRLMLVRELADTAREAGYQESQRRLIPLLGTFVTDTEPTVRQQFVEQLHPLATYLIEHGGESGYSDLINTFLPYTFELLVDKNVEVGSAAVAALTKLVELVKPEQVKTQLLNVVSTLAHDERSEDYRVVAAQLFNELAPRFGATLCKESVVVEVVRLADDTSFVVRKTVAGNLNKIGKEIGPEQFARDLLPVWQALAKDDIWGVRKACAESLRDISLVVGSEQRTTVLFDAFDRFADDVSRWVRVAAYQHLGEFISTCERSEVSKALVKRFTDMAAKNVGGDTDMAEYCAYSFPAVVSILGPERWSELEPAFMALTKDTQWKVRKMLSHSLHELAKVLGREIAEKTLTQAFDLFLRDLDEVKVGAVQSVSEFLEVLGTEQREKHVPFICQMPMESDNWRLRNLIALKMGSLAALVSPQVCKDKITELARKLLEDSVADVRQSAFESAATILKCLLPARSSGAHTDFLKYLLELPRNQNFQIRQMFIYICQEAARLEEADASLNIFEQEFLEPLQRLAQDKVANVRLAVARVFSSVLVNSRWAAKIQPVREQLQKDRDPDVRFYASH